MTRKFACVLNILSFSVSCDEIEIEHGIVTTHSVDQYLPGNTLNILCDDGYELQLGGKPYRFQYIVCDKHGHWDAYDGTGVLPECTGIENDEPENNKNIYIYIPGNDSSFVVRHHIPSGPISALVCGDPPIIEHASHHVVDPHGNTEKRNMEGVRAYYACDREYKLADENADVLKCEHTTWVGKKPVCLHRVNNDGICVKPAAIEHGYDKQRKSSFLPVLLGQWFA